MRRLRLALVVQRFGDGLSGGSERLCAEVGRSLALHHEVEILTSTARDFMTWAGDHAPGLTEVNGLRVRRFAVRAPRDPARWQPPPGPGASPEVRDEWVRQHEGPDVPDLARHLASEGQSFDLVIFFTFRHWSTFGGIAAVAERAVLAPTAEDDEALRWPIFRPVFAAARALIFLTPEERELVNELHGTAATPQAVLGMGVAVPPVLPDDAAIADFRSRHRLPEDFLLYLGRVTRSKGCDRLVADLERVEPEPSGTRPVLLMAGDGDLELPRTDWLRRPGYLSDADRVLAIRGARAFVMPSALESFSIATLEAMALGTPALVNGACRVLVGHCLRSGGGLAYSGPDELAAALEILGRPGLAAALGASARRYVEREYDPAAVAQRTREFIEATAA